MVEPNHLLIIARNDTAVKTNCRKNINQQLVKGNILVYFENCSIHINDIEYNSKTPIFWDVVEIISTLYNEIEHNEISEPLTLQKLNDWTFDNLKEINMLKQKTNNKKFEFIIIGVAVSIIVLYTGYKVLQNLRKKRKSKQVQGMVIREADISQGCTETSNKATKEKPFRWPTLHTKRGGVTSLNSTSG